jgi:exopolyphosphatase/guanosine-5'-triphosphate,3'-diphosphate pyrophosphatase
VLGAIDIGSNTARLLIGSIKNGQVIPALYRRKITRLKGGQTESGLAFNAMDRTLLALKEFSAATSLQKVDAIRVVGTEAVRSAMNRHDFISRVFAETGLTLEVISGDEEALLTSTGVCSVLDSSSSSNCVLIFDIGGGSTEFILLNRGEIIFQRSFRLGVVDLVESFTDTDQQIDRINSTISDLFSLVSPLLKSFNLFLEDVTLVGTAGTVTTLAAMDMQMIDYDWRRVNGYEMSYLSIEALSQQLTDLSVDERENLPGMEKGRGDLIPIGIGIVLELMRQFRSQTLTISDFGLLEGILLSFPENLSPE